MLRRTAALLMLAVVSAGCSESPGSLSVADGAPEDSTSAQPTEPTVDYVALGDSYTAGPLISTVRSDPSACARSTNNYPAFLAEWLHVRSYRDVSCSGAATADLTAPQRLFGGGTVPPQQRVLSPETDLVTVGLGGNDFDLFARLGNCGQPLAQPSSSRACDLDAPSLLADAEAVEQRLVRTLRQVKRKATRADLVVVGYPQVLPATGTCALLGVEADDADTARRVASRLNDSLRAAARRVDALWVDLAEVSSGHDACAGDAAWITGAEYVRGEPAPLHPRIEGMRGAASAVFSVITGEEPPGPAGAPAAPERDAVVRN